MVQEKYGNNSGSPSFLCAWGELVGIRWWPLVHPDGLRCCVFCGNFLNNLSTKILSQDVIPR